MWSSISVDRPLPTGEMFTFANNSMGGQIWSLVPNSWPNNLRFCSPRRKTCLLASLAPKKRQLVRSVHFLPSCLKFKLGQVFGANTIVDEQRRKAKARNSRKRQISRPRNWRSNNEPKRGRKPKREKKPARNERGRNGAARIGINNRDAEINGV
jgi:hypothetical protein